MITGIPSSEAEFIKRSLFKSNFLCYYFFREGGGQHMASLDKQ